MTPMVTFVAGLAVGLAIWPVGRWLWSMLMGKVGG